MTGVLMPAHKNIHSPAFQFPVNPAKDASGTPAAETASFVVASEPAQGVVSPDELKAMIAGLKTFCKTFEDEITAPIKARVSGKEFGAQKNAALAPYKAQFDSWDAQIKTAEEAAKTYDALKDHDDQRIKLEAALTGAKTLGEALPETFAALETAYADSTAKALIPKIAALPVTVDNVVVLAEMSNTSAKLVADQAKQSAPAQKKILLEVSSDLMKTAKNIGLQGAMVLGAVAYASTDDEDKTVTILKTDRQQIGLHQVPVAVRDTFALASDHAVKHNGSRRQWLAPITMAALTSGNEAVADAIMGASSDAARADAMNEALMKLSGEATLDGAVKALTPGVLASIKPDGTLDASSKLVQALEAQSLSTVVQAGTLEITSPTADKRAAR